MDNKYSVHPYVEMFEQPASRSVRFRYECEGRSASCILGANNSSDHKTFPSIRIIGYKGPCVIVVSCVTKKEPYQPHPHSLVGKGCQRGVCTIKFNVQGSTPIKFTCLGIQCVKKKDIKEALLQRQTLRIDPFRTGYDHLKHQSNIDLNAVRLCFQVFIEGATKEAFNLPLTPIVSDIIYDKKATPELSINSLSHASAPVTGGMKMIILCDKITHKNDDIEIIFFETNKDGEVTWKAYGEYTANDVHRQCAITFTTPAYRLKQVNQPIQVYIQLRRRADNELSEAYEFELIPALDPEIINSLKRKRLRYSTSGPIDLSPAAHRPDCQCKCFTTNTESNVNKPVIPNPPTATRTLLQLLQAENSSQSDLMTFGASNNSMRNVVPTTVVQQHNITTTTDVQLLPVSRKNVPQQQNNFVHTRPNHIRNPAPPRPNNPTHLAAMMHQQQQQHQHVQNRAPAPAPASVIQSTATATNNAMSYNYQSPYTYDQLMSLGGVQRKTTVPQQIPHFPQQQQQQQQQQYQHHQQQPGQQQYQHHHHHHQQQQQQQQHQHEQQQQHYNQLLPAMNIMNPVDFNRNQFNNQHDVSLRDFISADLDGMIDTLSGTLSSGLSLNESEVQPAKELEMNANEMTQYSSIL